MISKSYEVGVRNPIILVYFTVGWEATHVLWSILEPAFFPHVLKLHFMPWKDDYLFVLDKDLQS